ncbi:uncharacterized protein LOC124163406 [Ischnura elegans]|uniref:uncharacterized protein LOC124163406 n=1 Tax=Ischnura elegans TaxID=197161 RepID=UPI001ED88F62|nr:uncharacterized protein LOC124163406 [Ischnura elegans]
MSNTIVVIRDFQPGDDVYCKELVREATMSTVNASFMTGLTQEITFQGIVICAAVMFIFLGVPLSYCLAAIPVFLFLMYIFIWLGHTMKAIELTQEMNNIARMYMSSKHTGFWVAEVYDPPLLLGGLKKNLRFETVTEKEFLTRNINVNSSKKLVVGTVAIAKSRTHPDDCARLRRLSVAPLYRGHGIGTALTEVALSFCRSCGYTRTEAVTSECHDAARRLLMSKGFEMHQMYHRPILGRLVAVIMYELVLKFRSAPTSQEP